MRKHLRMSVVGTLKDITIYGGIISFTLWPSVFNGPYKWRSGHNVPLQPPRWAFMLVWPVLYGLMAASWLVALYNSGEDDVYVAAYALFAASIVLNILWLLAANRFRASRVAFFLILLIVGSAVALAVVLGIGSLWVSFGLVIPYVVWVCFATYLNGYYAFTLGEPMVELGDKPLPSRPLLRRPYRA